MSLQIDRMTAMPAMRSLVETTGVSSIACPDHEIARPGRHFAPEADARPL